MFASPRLASPRLASPRLASPRLPRELSSALRTIVVVLAVSWPALASSQLTKMQRVAGLTHAVIDGTVSSVTFSFDAMEGPRYEVTFNSASTILGPTVQTPLTLKISGGPIPNSNYWYEESTAPHFALGERYIVFLVNDTRWRWFSSPVVLDNALSVRTAFGMTRVFTQSGMAITGISDAGWIMGGEVFSNDFTIGLPHAYAPPELIPEAQSPDVANAMTPEAFIGGLTAYLGAHGLAVGAGTFFTEPDPTRYWDTTSVEVDETNEPGCPGGQEVCLDIDADVLCPPDAPISCLTE